MIPGGRLLKHLIERLALDDDPYGSPVVIAAPVSILPPYVCVPFRCIEGCPIHYEIAYARRMPSPSGDDAILMRLSAR